MPEKGTVYIDTNALIYSVERAEPYRTLLEPLWEGASAEEFDIVSSESIVLEVLVKPLREDNQALVNLLSSMFNAREVRLIPPIREHWVLAAQLRADTGLKAADALHAATALLAEVALFITNDRDFRRVDGLPVVVLSDLLNDDMDANQAE